MVKNCSATLSHLEAIVDKYMELKTNNEEPGQADRKRWGKELRENWKKIRWTAEGGGLEKLRVNLAVHINDLNSAISALNRRV